MSEWVESPLAELANIVSGGTPSRDVPAYWGGEIPWVTPTDITACRTNYLEQTEDTISKQGLLGSSAKLLPAGAILLTSRASIGLSKIARIPVTTNQGFKSLVPKRGIDGTFLFYQTQRLRGAFERFAAGSTFLEINKKDTERILLPHPTGAVEQKKIATILSGIDIAIEKTEALIAKYQQIKAGLMHDLFTRGVLPNGQLRPPREQAPELYQKTTIGWIPRDWEVAAIEKVLTRIIDYRGKTPEKTVSGIPLITAKNVRMGYIDPEPREFIDESAYATWMTRGVPNKGDVLFTTEAPLGNVAQVPSDDRVAFAQRAIILQPSEVIEATFLAYRLMTETTQNAISRLASGSTALGIKQSEFRKVCIAFPNAMVEQIEVSRRLQAIDDFIDEQRNAQHKLQSQKSGLMHDLLTGKVPVNIESKTTTTEAVA